MNRLPVRFNSNFISKKIDFSAHRCPSAAQRAFLPVTRSRSICAGVLSVVMMWSGIGLATAEDMGPVSKKHIKLKKEAKHHKPLPTGPVFKDAPVAAAAAIPPCSQQSAAALQNTYALKGWIIPVPNFGDSVSQDYGCYRTNLAKYGIGFFGYGVGILETNVLNHYVPASNLQQYAGQRTLGITSTSFYLTYDLSQFGVPDGQIAIGGQKTNSTWIGYTNNSFGFGNLTYYQTLFNKSVEFEAGILNLNYQFVGSQVGGNIANVLGPGLAVMTLMGGNNGPVDTPTVTVKWNMTDRLYDKFGVSRSLPGTSPDSGAYGNALEVEHYANPTSVLFNPRPCVNGICYPTGRELFINELGYKNKAAPNDPATWVRVDAYYNNTRYNNLETAASGVVSETNTDGIQILADRQLWQADPGSPLTAYKGVYAGITAAYMKPQASALSQAYEARLYSYGLFGRPKDQISFIYDHSVYSPYIVNPTDASASCSLGIVCIRHAVNQYTILYTANIVPGVYVSLGAAYADHPAAAWSPNGVAYGSAASPILPQYNIKNDLNFLASTFVNF